MNTSGTFRARTVLAMGLAVMILSPVSFGAFRTPITSHRDNSTNRQKTDKPADQPATDPDVSDSTAANNQAAVAQALDDLATANQALQAAQAKVTAEFQQSDDWTAAQQRLGDAKADLGAVQKKVVERLATRPDYVAAQARYDQAVAKLEGAGHSVNATPEMLLPLATEKLDARRQVRAIEKGAMDADAGARAAATSLAAAQAGIDQLTAKLADLLANDPDVASAQQAVDDAKQALADARTALAAARKNSATNTPNKHQKGD